MKRLSLLLILGSSVLFSSALLAAGVERGQFTTDVIDREPVDQIYTLSSDNLQVKFFSEIMDMQGQTVTHQWIFNDEIMFEKSFDVGGPRWRIWTSKNLQASWTGQWTVNILDGERNVLNSYILDYQ
ncbi:MAG: DUF2914 domain-containing protein [Gammaproteobacteria bacterium]|nr:DUF2914 domain-containing protein [Gammaproteobacteria bacterium]